MLLVFYVLVLIGLFIYSYALVDPNLTLINHPWWVLFRDQMVNFGYYQRMNSWYVYLIFVIVLFIFHYFFVKKYKQINPLVVGTFVGGILLLSYPLLSHDLFNYIFDAKIFTYYGDNPYTHVPLSYANDEWLRFMHWTHRTYPYGPTYLVFSFIPSYLGMGKFILNFTFFKLTSVIAYIVSIYFLQKIDKKTAIVFATHPLILIDGLVAAHNDLIGVAFAIAGMYTIMQDKQWLGRFLLLFSGGIKYLTAPFIFFQKKNMLINSLLCVATLALIIYLCLTREMQSWYFLTLFAFLPIYKTIISRLNIFLFAILVSYYPFIATGFWQPNIKFTIIFVGLGLNVLYLILKRKEVLQEFSLKK